MKEQDIEQVMDVWLTTTIKAHPFIEEKYWVKHYPTVKQKYLKVAKTYVYEENGVVVGFLSLLNQSYIGALFVIPGCQKRKIGSALLEMIQAQSDALEVHAYERNAKAVHFYKKHGFEAYDRQNNLDSQYPEIILKWNK